MIASLLLVLSLAGFLDATYLTIQHYQGAEMVCGPIWDCETVANSRYAELGGVPISLGGAIFYLAIFLLMVGYVDTKQSRILTIVAFLSFPGFLASLILVYLQVFVLRALCFYCLLSILISTGIFAVALIHLYRGDLPDP